MGYIESDDGKIGIHGNFAPITKKKPRDFMEDYKVFVPYPFNFREKIGGVECDCINVLECYMPYYGSDWYHEDRCALIQDTKKRPHLMNLWPYSHLPQIPVSQE